MDKDSDLASKVDALTGKHSGANVLDDDGNIPLLTEVIDAPAWTPPSAVIEGSAPSALARLSDAEVDLLSHDILTRVFDRLDGSLGAKIERRLNEQLQAQIKSAVLNVLTDLRQEVANEIGDAVNAALADHLRDLPPR